MVVVCGKVLGWVGKIFMDIFGMRWVWEIGYGSGWIVGVEINLLRRLSWSCMILLWIRRLWWSLYWCGFMRRRIGVGMCSFIEFEWLGIECSDGFYSHLVDPYSLQWGWRPDELEVEDGRDFEIQSFYCGLRASSFVILPWKSIWGRSS